MNGFETRALHGADAASLSTFAVDTRDHCTQAVAATYTCEPDGRFYVVEAQSGREALEIALAARKLGWNTVAEYRANIASQIADTGNGEVLACKGLAEALHNRAAQTGRQVVMVLCSSATPMRDLRILEEVRSRLGELNMDVVSGTEEARIKSQIERDVVILDALTARSGISELLGPTIAALEEIPRLVAAAAPVNDRPAWASPYGPARRRR